MPTLLKTWPKPAVAIHTCTFPLNLHGLLTMIDIRVVYPALRFPKHLIAALTYLYVHSTVPALNLFHPHLVDRLLQTLPSAPSLNFSLLFYVSQATLALTFTSVNHQLSDLLVHLLFICWDEGYWCFMICLERLSDAHACVHLATGQPWFLHHSLPSRQSLMATRDTSRKSHASSLVIEHFSIHVLRLSSLVSILGIHRLHRSLSVMPCSQTTV